MSTFVRSTLWGLIVIGILIGTLFALTTIKTYSMYAVSKTGTNYYVDCSVKMNGNGSKNTPWNSLSSVNKTGFGPGDRVFFQRGKSCSGELIPQGSGSAGLPISINAYGSGALPIIDGGNNEAALKLSDQQYWEISNLEIKGGNPRGLWITGNKDNVTLHHFRLTNLQVHDVKGSMKVRDDTGIVILVPDGEQEAFDDVIIDGVTAYNTKRSEGIRVSAGGYKADKQHLNTNVTIQNSTSHDVGGDGIVVYETRNALLQNNVAYNSGQCPVGTCTDSTPSGIWEYYCFSCIVQYNESYGHKTWYGDGGDYDIDIGNHDNIVQYNYGHDAEGPCLSVFGGGSEAASQVTSNSILRYNVCSNNHDPNDVLLYAETGDSINGVQIYNNTFYRNPTQGNNNGSVLMDQAEHSGSLPNVFKNNLIYATNFDMIFTSTAKSPIQLDNNLYWTTGGNTPTWFYLGKKYSSFADYQAGSRQDKHGRYVNPLLNDPTYHAIGKPTKAFMLGKGSPAIGAGAVIANNGGQDFYRNPVSSTTSPNIGAYNGPGVSLSGSTTK